VTIDKDKINILDTYTVKIIHFIESFITFAAPEHPWALCEMQRTQPTISFNVSLWWRFWEY